MDIPAFQKIDLLSRCQLKISCPGSNLDGQKTNPQRQKLPNKGFVSIKREMHKAVAKFINHDGFNLNFIFLLITTDLDSEFYFRLSSIEKIRETKPC